MGKPAIKWRAFHFERKSYDLSHLHPTTVTYVQAAKKGKPEHAYKVNVIFSLHCFTRGILEGETVDPKLFYGDGYETRLIEFQRYELSYRLPGIVGELMDRKCYHTGRTNYTTVELVSERHGITAEYEIYFTVARASKIAIELYVESAYMRDPEHMAGRPVRKAIGFAIILFNVLNNRPVVAPK